VREERTKGTKKSRKREGKAHNRERREKREKIKAKKGRSDQSCNVMHASKCAHPHVTGTKGTAFVPIQAATHSAPFDK
jgi:hypothetical protein